MDPTIATSVPATTGAVHFLNIEYVFYLLYQWLTGAHGVTGGVGVGGIISFLTAVWVAVTVLAYVLTLGFLVLLVHSTIRMYQIKDETDPRFATITDVHKAEEEVEHHRWKHVRELIESSSETDWRQAIIEADIILDDMLMRLGIPGETLGDRLRNADPAKFHTLRDAGEAHGIRNRIAHDGVGFPLTDHLAYRTILQYENVFKEHGEI